MINKDLVQKIIYLAILISITATGYFASGTKSNANFPAATSVTPVNAVKIKTTIIEEYDDLPGRMVAYQSAEIRPQVDGIVMETVFKEGGEVKKGDQLYQIDPAIYLANNKIAAAILQRTQANLEAVLAKKNRYQKLVKSGAITKQEYNDIVADLESAKSNVLVAQAELEKNQIYLDYTKVLAPMSGFITRSIAYKGSLVTASQENPLAIITKLDPIYVEIPKSSEDLMRLRNKISGNKMLPVQLMFDGKTYENEGLLEFAEVNVDPSTSSVILRAIFENPNHDLLPGSFVKVKIKLGASSAILVPQKAAIRQPDGTLSVWIIDENNSVNPSPIQASKTFGSSWVVEKGLKEGDVIVVEGFQKIRPESKVKPIFSKNN
ncbi:MAG: membrane fusion protein (multidrug efflux system) [Lentimonas sp.]|jgi:membrane fusion protein (multidrug efflux system)